MKTLMVFLPVTENWMAPPTTTILTGALESAGYESSNFDMNAEFYNFMSEPENLKLFKKEYEELERTISKNQGNDNSKCEKNLFLEKQGALINMNTNILMLMESMYSARDFFKNSEKFYDMNECLKRYEKTDTFLSYAFNFSLCYHNLISENSLLQKFADLMVEKIVEYNPDLIGESVTYEEQSVLIRILNKSIKQKINPHISLGGFLINHYTEFLLKDFDYFCADSFCYSGAGEASMIKLADYLSGKCQEKDVSGLIYIDENGELVKTEVSKEVPKFYSPSFKGIDKDKYFVPEPIFSIETTKGCYWHRCAFCFNVTDETPIFVQKEVDDLFNQLKEIKEKYGVRNFEFVNHCIHPNFLGKFAQKLIDEKLDIRYMSFLRIEKEFDEELLSLLYKSGLRVVQWGVESGSNRILEHVDKGTTAELSEKVLKAAHKVGIFNHIFIMFGFPTETNEERQMSLDFIERNLDVIDSIKSLPLWMEKDSLFAKYPERYGFKQTDVSYGEVKANEISQSDERSFVSRFNEILSRNKYKNSKFFFRGEGLLYAIKNEKNNNKFKSFLQKIFIKKIA